MVALVPLLTVAEQGRVWGWDSARSITAYVVGGLGLVAFYLAERAMGDEALIPLRLFRIRAAAITILASIAIGAAMFGGILILPLYMQIVHGASPTEAGLLMLPHGARDDVRRPGLGKHHLPDRPHPRLPPGRVGAAGVGLLLLSTTSADTSLVTVDLFMLVLGVGLGNCMQPLLLIMQSAVPPSEIGVATSSATFFRQIGGTLGVAVFLSILFSTVGANIADEFEKAAQTPAFQQVVANPTPADAAVLSNGPAAAAQVQSDSSFIETLSPALAHPFKQGFAASMDLVFLMGAGVGLIAFLLLLFMPKVELRATSAAAAVRAEAGAARPRRWIRRPEPARHRSSFGARCAGAVP